MQYNENNKLLRSASVIHYFWYITYILAIIPWFGWAEKLYAQSLLIMQYFWGEQSQRKLIDNQIQPFKKWACHTTQRINCKRLISDITVGASWLVRLNGNITELQHYMSSTQHQSAVITGSRLLCSLSVMRESCGRACAADQKQEKRDAHLLLLQPASQPRVVLDELLIAQAVLHRSGYVTHPNGLLLSPRVVRDQPAPTSHSWCRNTGASDQFANAGRGDEGPCCTRGWN